MKIFTGTKKEVGTGFLDNYQSIKRFGGGKKHS